MTYKYYRILNNDDKYEDQSPLSFKLRNITGFNVNDYIKPVIQKGGEIVTIIADESEFKGHFSSGLIILPYQKKEFQNKLETELEKLVKKYGIENIHFTSIFGKERILKNNTTSFLKEYSAVVNKVPMACLSISKSKDILLTEMEAGTMSNEEIFFSLFWNNLERMMSIFPNHSIFHIYMEQEYSLEPKTYHNVAMKLFNKLYSGIYHLYSRMPDKYMSVCKHPHYFTKKALYYSSLSDFLAYSSNKIQNKIDSGISDSKIMKEYKITLQLFKSIFTNYSGLSSNKLIELINKS
ncbi:MAG: hypothetical protein Q6358_09770 [Candidatus Brocadiales bacterium]|nr:hypothetical protein [Candidatus Brocadiales bacterium]